MPILILNLFYKYDAIIVVSPPFHLGLLGMVYSKIKRIPIIYHIQDLQVDIAKNLNLINNKRILYVLEKADAYILKNVYSITTISEGMRRKVAEKGVNIDKVELLPNWVDTSFIKPLDRESSLRERFNVAEHDFVVLYAGNMGEKQGLEHVIEAANGLSAHKHIKFIFVGGGLGKHRLSNKAAQLNLKNISFFDLQPYSDLPNLLSTANIHLVLQKKGTSDLILPSKLTGILSSGGISIITAVEETFLFQEITLHDFGYIIEPENTSELVSAIIYIRNNQLLVEKYKKNALRYAEEFLDRSKVLHRFEHFLLNTVSTYKSVITMEIHNRLPLLSVKNENVARMRNRVSKRFFDIVFSLFVIIFILSWLYPILGILIKLESKGPILFKQQRIGYKNQPFTCYKFRSMVVHEEDNTVTQASKNDDRITKSGAFIRRTNIDEIPQFFNVLIGNMSVVGPRPHAVAHDIQYQNKMEEYILRHYALPGITGWAQVNGWRGPADTDGKIIERTKHDIWYLQNWTFGLDIKIIWMTLFNKKSKENAF